MKQTTDDKVKQTVAKIICFDEKNDSPVVNSVLSELQIVDSDDDCIHLRTESRSTFDLIVSSAFWPKQKVPTGAAIRKFVESDPHHRGTSEQWPEQTTTLVVVGSPAAKGVTPKPRDTSDEWPQQVSTLVLNGKSIAGNASIPNPSATDSVLRDYTAREAIFPGAEIDSNRKNRGPMPRAGDAGRPSQKMHLDAGTLWVDGENLDGNTRTRKPPKIDFQEPVDSHSDSDDIFETVRTSMPPAPEKRNRNMGQRNLIIVLSIAAGVIATAAVALALVKLKYANSTTSTVVSAVMVQPATESGIVTPPIYGKVISGDTANDINGAAPDNAISEKIIRTAAETGGQSTGPVQTVSGTVVDTGVPSQNAIDKAMAEIAPTISRCKMNLPGKLTLKMKADGRSGRVLKSEAVDKKFAESTIGYCASSAALAVRFDPFTAAEYVFTYTFDK